MKDLLLAPAAYRLEGRVWVQGPDDRFLGIGRLELLGHIRATGSISRAAAAMGMSYKRAWDLVHSMNAQARQPLVATQTGGKSGGGAALTPRASRPWRPSRPCRRASRRFWPKKPGAWPSK